MVAPIEKQFVFRKFPRSTRLAIVAFFMALAYSFVGTIWAVHIKSFVGEDYYVGFVISFLALISIISYIFIVSIIQKQNKGRIFRFAIFGASLFYFILAFTEAFYLFIGVAILLTFFASLRINSFGVIVKEISSNKSISKNQGLIYTFLNTAWLVGPILAGIFAVAYGNRFIFLIASFVLLITFLLFNYSNVRVSATSKKKEKSSLKNAMNFFRSKDRIVSYLLGGGVNFWWIFIYTFMPLYIIQQGFSEAYIGYFLFAIALPLIILEYHFSKLIGRLKYKTLFKIGYFIPGVLALMGFFIYNSYFIFVILILASVGLAMIEPTTEAYFLRLMNKKQELKYYGIYNTTIDFNFLIASLMSSFILLIFPFRFLFLFFGVSMILLFLLSFKARNIK